MGVGDNHSNIKFVESVEVSNGEIGPRRIRAVCLYTQANRYREKGSQVQGEVVLKI